MEWGSQAFPGMQVARTPPPSQGLLGVCEVERFFLSLI